VPKLWSTTIESHRRTVRDAILDTTAALAAKHGLASVTMSQIAAETGVGRATLYKYFPDVDAILVSWHERHVDAHLGYLAEVRDRFTEPSQQLEAVLRAYALIPHERARGHHRGRGPHAHARDRTHPHARDQAHLDDRHGGDVAALVHRTEHVAGIQRRLSRFIGDVIARAARAGAVRDDVPAAELAQYCLAALGASSALPSKAAVQRLVATTLAGLREPRGRSRP
jgi:AcrR family transcriptional regulator